MNKKSAGGIFAALLLWAGQVLADLVQVPSQYSLGSMAASSASTTPPVEHQETIDGTQYTVVTPIFTGSDGNLSYMRFTNRDTAANTTTITIVGWPSGNVYGTVNVQVPSHASPQYSITQILSALNIAGPTNGDQGFSLYLKNGNPNAGFAHVIFNGANGFFEDLSMCVWEPTVDYSALNSWIFNVHTTQLSAYPAIVFVHNYSNQPQTFLVDVYEAAYGGYKGTISVQANANATYGIPFSWFQTQAQWSPSGTELHSNLNFRPSTPGAALTVTVGQTIFNQAFTAYVNMSQTCAINH